LEIEIPDDNKDDIINSFAENYKHPQTVADEEGKIIPNPTTNEDFFKSMINTYIKEVYKSFKVKAAEQTRDELILIAEQETSGITVKSKVVAEVLK
jgi:hypothetical protein